MPSLAKPISIALETTCRRGGVALGAADELLDVLAFDAERRAATQVVTRLDELLHRRHLKPAEIDEVYVSAGPGSFTGTRVGVTVARILAQAVPSVRVVAVPTVQAVAANVEPLREVEHLAVILDARRGKVYAAPFERRGAVLVQGGPPRLAPAAELLAGLTRPLYLAGEGLAYHELEGDEVVVLGEEYWFLRVETVWRLGRRRAAEGAFTAPRDIRCIYTGAAAVSGSPRQADQEPLTE